jgi:hypothetical protein
MLGLTACTLALGCGPPPRTLPDWAGSVLPDAGAAPMGPTQKPLFTLGVETEPSMLVRHPDGDAVYDNLYAAGGILAGATRWQEKSGEGIALASAVRAADSILATAASVATSQGAAS